VFKLGKFTPPPPFFRSFLSLLLALALNPLVFADDTLTITTYYPSPYGVYREMRSQRLAIGDNYIDNPDYTWEEENGDGGEIDYLADLVVEGNVGIGTTTPEQKLDVAGYIKAGHPYFIASSSDCWRAATAAGWITVVHNQVIAGNSGGWYNASNGRFTAPVKGLYLFIAQHYIYSSQAGYAYIHHLIGVNGDWNGAGNSSNSGSYTIFGMNMGTYDSSTSTTTLLYLNAGDYVNDNVYISGAGTYYMCGYHSFFQGVLLYAQ